ncbi:hypothetical protein GCM10023259_080840 [Thermocatellispora tengchongensis]
MLREVDAHRGQSWVHIGDRKQRLMLAVLLLADAEPVSIDELIVTLWDDEPIKSARKVVHHYASELRHSLGRTASGTQDMLPDGRGGAYRLIAGREEVDVHRFRDQAHKARAALRHDDEAAARGLRAALREWGADGLVPAGEPLRGLPGRWAAEQRERLRQEHRDAVIECLEAELRLGHHARLIPELSAVAHAGPPDERVTELLMLAYQRSGRPVEALNVYTRFRNRLAEEAGAEPGPGIVRLRRRILRRGAEPHLIGQG